MSSCSSCNAPNPPKRCPCRQVYYCSIDCQKQHWGVHKVTCTKLKKNDPVRQVTDEFNAAPPPRANSVVPGVPMPGITTALLETKTEEKKTSLAPLKEMVLDDTDKLKRRSYIDDLMQQQLGYDQTEPLCYFNGHVVLLEESKSLEASAKHRKMFDRIRKDPMFPIESKEGKSPGTIAICAYIASLPFEYMKDTGVFTIEELDAINLFRSAFVVPSIPWSRCVPVPPMATQFGFALPSVVDKHIKNAAQYNSGVIIEHMYNRKLWQEAQKTFRDLLTNPPPHQSTFVRCTGTNE